MITNPFASSKSLGIAVAAALALAGACRGAVLGVPQYNQEKDQWCWNASSQMVLAFKGHSYSQTAIASWAVGGQNIPNYLYGSTDSSMHGCDEILSHFGSISSTGSASAMSLSNLEAEMNASRPVLVRWGWASGGGHILVVRGTSGSSVYINDPWPDNGQSVNTYSWLCSAEGHTWTHTLKLNSSGDNQYYQAFVSNYNTAMAYLSYYNATGSLYYLSYYNYYYGYAAYYYFKYYGNNSNAYYYYYYYMALANYYYDYYYYGGYAFGYSYSMSDYCYYLANAYYYGYYYAGYTNAAYAYYYYYRAYEYYYYAYAIYYYYASYGYYDYANYYYDYYMSYAQYYYNLSRQYM